MSIIGNGILNLLTPPDSGSTWYFNSSIPRSKFEYNVNFTSDGFAYIILYLNGPNRTNWNLFYSSPSLDTLAYSKISGWQSESLRTITITGGEDATNPDFLAWLEANATQIN